MYISTSDVRVPQKMPIRCQRRKNIKCNQALGPFLTLFVWNHITLLRKGTNEITDGLYGSNDQLVFNWIPFVVTWQGRILIFII